MKGLPILTQTMNPYAYGVNNPLAHPDPGEMLIANFDDPLMPCEGDSPQSARAQKLPEIDTVPHANREECAGINDHRRRWWGADQYYLDHCVTMDIVTYLGFGGGGVGAITNYVDKFVKELPKLALKTAAIVQIITWVGAIELYTADRIGGRKGVIITFVPGLSPPGLFVTPQ